MFNGKTYEIPSPTLCLECRQQRRMVWRNERRFYKRTCSKTKNTIIAMYPPDTPFPVLEYMELDFYRSMNIPIPRLHPDERHIERMQKRISRILHKRRCTKCERDIQTTYAPDKPETVYCEECYLAEVY